MITLQLFEMGWVPRFPPRAGTDIEWDDFREPQGVALSEERIEGGEVWKNGMLSS